jgi:PAS domain S-box-containing protein
MPVMTTAHESGSGSGAAPGLPVPAAGTVSLRARVLGLVIVALMPALLASAWYLARDAEQAQDAAYEKAGVLASTTASALQWILDDARDALERALPVGGPAEDSMCPAAQAPRVVVTQKLSLAETWRLDGTRACAEGAAATTAMQPPGWFAPALAAGGFKAGGAWQAAADAPWVSMLSMPVRDPQGRTEGLVTMSLDLAALNARLFAGLPEGALVAVLDDQHRVMLRSSDFAARVGRQAPQRFVDAARGGGNGMSMLEETGVDGVRRLYATLPLASTGWRVWAALPEDEVLAPWRAERNRTLALVGAALVLISLAAWQLLRSTLRPVQALAQAARRVAEGSTSARAPVSGPAELRDVAIEFNRMLDTRDADAAALRASEMRFRTLIDQLPVGVVEHAADTSIRLFNAEACRLLGLTSEQMSGRQAHDPTWCFVDEQERRMEVADYPVTKVLRDGRPLQGMILGIQAHQGAERVWVHVNAFPEHDGAGRVQRVVVVFIDITARRQAEALREAREMAEMANRAKSVFLSRVSHELRTPLNAVLGFSQLLQLDPAIQASPTASRQTEMVHLAGEHLLALVDDLLDLARIEAGEMALRLEPLDLAPVVRECVAMVRPLADAAKVPVSVSFEGTASATVLAERSRLRQVLVNLLTNAVKYNRPQGSVEVRLVVRDGLCGVMVRDTGIGMTPMQLAALFQPFNRLGADSRGIEGTGLGLVIAHQLAELMGGRLDVASESGLGSTFTLWLPVTDAPAPAAPQPSAPPSPARMHDDRTMRCVYVEDNTANAQLVRQALALRPAVELALAPDGPSGLQRIRELRPHLVLLDLDLPLMNGHQVLQAVRAEGLVPQPGLIVAVTAWSTAQDVARAGEAGFDEVITKPFDIQHLLDVVDLAAARTAAASGKP